MADLSSGRADPLYVALDHFEDASNNVGSLTIVTQGAYRMLTDAIGGHGDLSEARARFHLEAAMLVDAHQQWAGAVQVLNAAVEDGLAWQDSIVHRHRCANCGAVTPRAGWCSDCVSNVKEAGDQSTDHSRGNPFAETDRQPYGERNVLGTKQL
jgi:hypothetical protein